MKKLVLFMLLTGGGLFAQSGVTISDSILSSGIYRKFRLYIPNIYNGNSAVPLVLNLHGYTSNATAQQAYSNFMAVADTANILVVHPEGTYTVGGQFWNAGYGPGVNDLQFMIDLVDSLDMIYNINNNRVYSCGLSNGGIMSFYLACSASNKFAAIASVAGTMIQNWFTCSPPRPFPVMEIHGTADNTVPYNGAGAMMHIDSVIKKWRVHNNCNPSPVTYSVPNINLADNSTAVNYRYINGGNNSTVELYKVNGGSHSWPGAVPVFTNTNQDFSATAGIWRFFRQYTLNQFITGVREFGQDARFAVYPNPTNGKILLNEICDADIFSIEGKLVCSEKQVREMNLNLSPGLYFARLKTADGACLVKLVIE